MLFLLDKDVRTVKWNGIPLHEASSSIVKEETNGDFYLTVRYPITDSGIYQLIKEDMLIKAPTPVLGAQLFRINKPIENDDSLDITAYHVSDDIMKRSITPVSVVGQGCAMALSQMVQNAKTGLGDFSFTSDIMDSRTFNTTETETLYSVLMDGKHSIVGTWEGELVRDNFALSIKRSRGADRGVVITTHKNLKSYQRTKNSQGVITRIHARSTFKPDGAEDEVTLRVTVDSPLINSYPYINEKEYENNNAETVEDLRKWAEAKFTNEGIDKVSDAIEIEAYELDGQVVHLGDTVNIKSRKHNVDLYKKAIAYEFNALTEEYISITFDDKPGVGGSGVSSGLSNAADAILGASATAQEIAVQRAVKNANAAFDAEFDKRAEKIYDGIEQAKADAEEYADKLKTEISQEFDTFDKEYQANKKSQDQQIADILAKAQANTNLATDAKNIGNQAKIDAANALAKALQYKNEAISEASRLDTVERQAAETKLATAKSQAISEANKLVETAKSLLAGQVSSVSTDLNQTKEAIKLLATRATVEALTGRVSSAESTLQVQAGEIASRVKTSDFDQAKQRISTAESSITQLGNRITTEISETVAKIPTGSVGNMLVNSGSGWKDLHTKSFVLADKIQEGMTYTVAAKWFRSDKSTLNVGIRVDSSDTWQWANLSYDWDLDCWTATFKSKKNVPAGRNFNFYTVELDGVGSSHWATLVSGSIPMTIWQPSLAELVTDITSAKTTINQTAEGQEQLSTRLTETQGKVTAAETNIRQLVNDVSSKVSQTTFDNLKKTVDSQGTSISQNQSAIALKAEKTYVDGVKATADSAKTTASDALSKANANADTIQTTQAELKVTSDAVKTKVSSTDFDKVDGRLKTAESTIVTQAGEIEKRLTGTQVETAISSKGYQTKADVDKNITDRGFATSKTVQNIVKETSDSFSRTITKTQAMIPSEYAGNLLVNSGNGWNNLHSISFQLSDRIYANSTYTVTARWWRSDNSTLNIGIRTNSSDPWQWVNLKYSAKIDAWTATFTSSKNLNAGDTITFFTVEANGVGNASWATLTKGSTPLSVWQPSTRELVTETKFNEVRDTVDAHKRLIGDGTAISETIQTAKGLLDRVGNIEQGQNLVYDPTNYSKYRVWSGSDVVKVGTNNYRLLRIKESGQSTRVWRGFQVPLHSSQFTQGEKLSYRLSLWVDVLPDDTVGFSIKEPNGNTIGGISIQPTRTGSNQIFTGTFTINKTVSVINDLHVWQAKNGTVAIGQLSIIRGENPPTSFVDSTSAMQLATETQVNQLIDSWSFKTLNSAGDILSQANLSSTQFLLEAAKIRLKGKTLADEIQAIDGKFNTLFVSDGTFGKLDATIIGAQAITGGQIKFDQAFFNNLMANEAYLKQLFAKNAFISQVQSVTMSASQISGGILTATNGAMQVNLNAGQIMYYTDQAALKRVLNGYPTQFVKFATGTVTGKGNAGVTVIGSNRWNSESSNDGGFVGIRAWNGANIDSIDLVGDDIRLASSAFDSPDGWDVRTLDSGLRIAPHNRAAERNSRIEVGDVWIMKGDGTYSSLRDILNSFNGNFSKGPNADSYTYYPKGF